jgi:hypothetical protein
MHLHFSPFQHATGLEVVTYDVSTKKVLKTLAGLTKADRMATRKMDSVMTCEQAARIPGTPTAFISPNPIGAMKDIHMPMAAVGPPAKPISAPAYDHSHRSKMRQGYGDRGVDKMLAKAGAM